MRRRLPTATALACAAGALLSGCGSGAKVVSAPNSPSGRNGATATTRTHTTSAHASTSSTATVTRTETATSTRTSAAPAFAEQESGGGALAAAVAVVRAHGYTPNDAAEYHPGQTLRVLTATRTGSGGGHDQRAFFFVDGRYIGTDASQPSASLKVISQGATSVRLGYAMYRSGDPMCCPSGGEATVAFQLDNGRLRALGPIPPAASSAAGLSRL